MHVESVTNDVLKLVLRDSFESDLLILETLLCDNVLLALRCVEVDRKLDSLWLIDS